MHGCMIRDCKKTPMWSDRNEVLWCDDHKPSLEECKELDVRFVGPYEQIVTTKDLPTGDQRINQFEGMDPKEINFITHPFWRELERQIDENEGFAYAITRDNKPVAVIVSAELITKMREDLQQLCDRLNEQRK